MRARRDADDARADFADLLARLDVLTDMDEIRAGVSVIHLHALERAGCDLQDRGVRAKATDPLADDQAIAHRVQRRATRSGVVNALIDGAIDDVVAGEGQCDAVAQHVRRRLCRRCRRCDHGDSPRSPGRRLESSAATTWVWRGADTRGPAGTCHQTTSDSAARAAGSSSRSRLATGETDTRRHPRASATRRTLSPALTTPCRHYRGVASERICADATSGHGCTTAQRRRSAGEVPPAARRRSRYRRRRSALRRARRHGGLAQHQHGRLEHDRPRPDVDHARDGKLVAALEVAHRTPRLRTEDPVHRQMRQRKDLVQSPLSHRNQRSLAAHLKHHPLTPELRRAIRAGVGAAGRVGNRGRLSRPDRPGERRSRGERGAQCERHALLPTPGAASQLSEPPALTRTSQGTVPQLDRSKISNQQGPFAYRIKARSRQ